MTPGSRYKQVFEKGVCVCSNLLGNMPDMLQGTAAIHYYKGQVPCTGPGPIFKWLRNGWQPSLVVWGCPWLVGWGWSLAWGSSRLSLVGSKFLLLLCGRVSRLRGHASPSWGCIYFVLNSFWCWFGWPSVSKEEEKKWVTSSKKWVMSHFMSHKISHFMKITGNEGHHYFNFWYLICTWWETLWTWRTIWPLEPKCIPKVTDQSGHQSSLTNTCPFLDH